MQFIAYFVKCLAKVWKRAIDVGTELTLKLLKRSKLRFSR